MLNIIKINCINLALNLTLNLKFSDIVNDRLFCYTWDSVCTFLLIIFAMQGKFVSVKVTV